MKRIFFVIFFSLVYVISPIAAFADSDVSQNQGQDQNSVIEESVSNESTVTDSEDKEGTQIENETEAAESSTSTAEQDTATSSNEEAATSTDEVATFSLMRSQTEAQNHLPVFMGPSSVSTHVGSLVEFVITANDEDGNPDALGHMVLRHDVIPSGATFSVGDGLFSWTPTIAGNYIATFTAFDGTGTSTHDVSIEVLANEEPNCEINGLYGSYYNLPKNHPNIETTITGVATGTTPFQFDWFADKYLAFKRNDLISTFNVPANYFPVNTGLEGDPFYFAVHWQGVVHTPVAGDYNVTLKSDDDSWLYINQAQVLDLGGIHALEGTTTAINLPAGTSTIDIYFAERHVVQSGIVFSIDGGVTFSSCVGSTSPQNLPPMFVNFNPPRVATSTELYSYDVEATDPENDPLEFSLTEKPEGMSIATSTGIISWTPTREQATTTPYNVTVQVSDPTHATTTSYQIVVSLPANRLPIIDAPDHVSGTVGNPISFTVTVSDPDGDVITQRQELPDGATFASSTFSWTSAHVGTFSATFFASDGTGTTTHTVAIDVTNPSSGGGGGGGGTTIVPASGGSGGGGGGNGPPIPIAFPVPPSYTTPSSGGGSTQPPVNIPVTNVPSKPTPVPAPVVSQVPTGGTHGISIVPTTTYATTTTAAGGRSLADLLLAGLFNVIDWLRANWCILGWILFIITLITFILYVIFSKEDRDDEMKEKNLRSVPPAPPEGMVFKNSPTDSAPAEYWETQTQEKE